MSFKRNTRSAVNILHRLILSLVVMPALGFPAPRLTTMAAAVRQPGP